MFPLSVEVFKNCPIIRTLLPTKKQPRDFASSQKCKNVSLYCPGSALLIGGMRRLHHKTDLAKGPLLSLLCIWTNTY